MHGKKFLVQEVLFGSDGESLFVRVDFRSGTEPELPGMEARITVQSLDERSAAACDDSSGRRRAPPATTRWNAPSCAFWRCAFRWPAPASPKAAACVSSSRYGRAGCRWTPSRSRAGWR